MHTGEQVAVNDVVRVAVHDGLFIRIRSACFGGGDERGADVGEVSAHGLRGQHGVATCNGATQRDGAVKPLADFLDQGKRALYTCVATGTGGHSDQAVSALFDRLACMFVVDDVV